MAISSVGQSDGAVPTTSVEPEQLPVAEPAVVEAPAAGSSGESGFDSASSNPLSLNPQLATLDLAEYSRLSDSEGRKKGTNDDSIGGGDTNATRPDIGKVALGPTGDLIAAVEGLSETTQAQVASLLANPETAAAVSAVLSNDTFALLPIDQREKMINVMAKSDPAGVEMMAYACETSGDISTLCASDGSTVMDNLNRMVEAGLGPYVANVITDMVRPDAIWQGRAPTCTAASMQYELAKQGPAEYSRIIAGLAIEGKVTMAGGGVLEIHPGAALDGSAKLNDQRSPSESVFQAALMEFCNGADETYDVNSLRSTRQNGTTHAGLNGEQIQSGLENLFGVKYATTNITSDEQAHNLLSTLNKSLMPNRPVLVDMVISDDLNHCVAFEGASNGSVRLRDPTTGRSYTITEEQWNRSAAAIHVVRKSVPSPVLSPIPSGGRGEIMIAAAL